MSTNNRVYKLWLVDDDPDDQYLVKKIVASLREDIELRCLDSGADFLSCLDLSAEIPDLVLLDLNMPIMGGLDVLDTLRAQKKLNVIPTVVFSTSQSEHDINEAYSKGARSFLSKSGNFAELAQQIETLCHYWLDVVSSPNQYC